MSLQLEQLGEVIHDIIPYVQERIPFSLGTTIHPYSPGDLVSVKDWKQQTVPRTWRGPYTVVLTTPSAVKVAGITPWTHHTRLKTAAEGKGHWAAHTNPEEPLKTRLIFHRRPQTQDGAATDDSAVPSWHDSPTGTANSG